MSEGKHAKGAWADLDAEQGDGANAAYPPLTRQQAQALRAKHRQASPWWVLSVQAGVGVVMTLLAWGLTGQQGVAWSVLYGAATAVVPGALMARGMTSRLSNMNLGASAVSFMLWEFVKIAVSVAMLMLAHRIVQPLSWPALLAGLVVCINMNWVALLWWQRRKKNGTE